MSSKIIKEAMRLIPKSRSSTIDGLLGIIERLDKENQELKIKIINLTSKETEGFSEESFHKSMLNSSEKRCKSCTKLLSELEQIINKCSHCNNKY